MKTSGAIISEHDLKRHLTNILAGLFSLGGKQDVALIEELIHFDTTLAKYSYEGLPDTRVIVFQGFPVMCMMRFPTAESDGKANLHQGAVGVGIWRIASRCYEMSGLGYIGTDIVLDRDRGPMLLELNARPGLAIQICNNAGLLPRLALVEELVKHTSMTVDERIAFSQKHFGVFAK